MVTGGCLCGAVRYEAGAVFNEGVCHCRTCQLAHGAPMVGWFSVRRDDFRLLSGELGEVRSSEHAVRRFCAACGTPTLFDDDDYPEEIDLAAATLDDPDAFAPTFHIWTRSQLPWVKLDDGLPRHPRSSRG